MLIIRRLIALMQHLVSSSQSVAVQRTERPLTERTIPDAASVQLAPDDEHLMLETCGGM